MILVTGATGFLGQRLCRRLEEASIAFTRTSLSLGTDLRDFGQTLALFEAIRPTIILNCASFAGGIQFGLKQPADMFRNNMPMIANLFEAAHQTGVEAHRKSAPQLRLSGGARGFRREPVLGWATP